MLRVLFAAAEVAHCRRARRRGDVSRTDGQNQPVRTLEAPRHRSGHSTRRVAPALTVRSDCGSDPRVLPSVRGRRITRSMTLSRRAFLRDALQAAAATAAFG